MGAVWWPRAAKSRPKAFSSRSRNGSEHVDDVYELRSIDSCAVVIGRRLFDLPNGWHDEPLVLENHQASVDPHEFGGTRERKRWAATSSV
jgi:hypothetical protein